MKFFIIVLLLLFSGCSNKAPHIPKRTKAIPQEDISPSDKEITNAPSPPAYVIVEETLGESFTELYDRSSARLNNIHLACESINGTEIQSGKEFSFNDICGVRSEEKGYQSATILHEKKLEKGIGGGVCQVSSTIHMAAINAGFKVTERHSHSAPVNYAPKGLDAAVSYGYLDFKFVNTSPDAIIIYTWCNNEKIYVKLTHKVTVSV